MRLRDVLLTALMLGACGMDEPLEVDVTPSCRSLLAGTQRLPAGYPCKGRPDAIERCYSFDGTGPNEPMSGCYMDLHLVDNSAQMTRAYCLAACQP